MKRFDMKGYLIADNDKWIYDWLEMSSTSHKDVQSFLTEADGDDVEIFIDSPGGLTRIGSAIYGELRAYKGKSTAYILGVSASAATVAMIGADKVIAIPTAQVFAHNTQTKAAGDYRTMEEAATMLKDANEAIINAYELKTGLSREKLQELMDKNTWMTAQEAKNYGFVDEIALKEGEQLSELQITAALPMAAGISSVFNAAKMHEAADKLKPFLQENADPMEATMYDPKGRAYKLGQDSDGKLCIIEITADKTAETSNENEGESKLVSDIQKQKFRDLRKKLYS